MDLQVVLWLIALILFAVSAFVNPPRVSLMALGLAFLAAGFLAHTGAFS